MVLTIWCKINSTSYYGTTNNLPRMTVTYDGTSTTYAVATESTDWQLLVVPFTALTTTSQITVTFSCYTLATGTDAYVYFDDMSVLYPAGYIMNLGGFDYWFNGEPVTPPISTLFSATDVWTVSTSALTATGTTGKALSDTSKSLKLADFVALK
jgi:hypothetical protein